MLSLLAIPQASSLPSFGELLAGEAYADEAEEAFEEAEDDTSVSSDDEFSEVSDAEEAKSSSSASSGSSDKSSSSKKKSSKKDGKGSEDEEDEEEDVLSEEEVEAVETASEEFSKAETLAASFSDAASELGTIAQDLSDAREALEEIQEKRANYREHRMTTTVRMVEAQERNSDADERLEELSQTNVLSLVLRETSLDEIAAEVEELEEEQEENDVIIEEEIVKIDSNDDTLKKYDKKIAKRQEQVEEAIERGNEVAMALESADSASRVYDSDATETVEELDEEKTDAQRIYSQADEINENHDSSRSAARDALSDWYCSVDDVSGIDSDLTFGTGDDFSLSEEEFVAKWGAAIDAFYEQYGEEYGFTPPLEGYGDVMAECAYEYEVDPRLCAAVSIAESSGGEYCIKPHNAWGWGAVDSDPYNQAYSWSSWEAAIEAWHKGLAESSTGLATAGSVSALGEIYASASHWAGTVCEQMEQISACVDDGATEEALAEAQAETSSEDGGDGADGDEGDGQG